MKKLFIPLICFLILAFVSSTGARMPLTMMGASSGGVTPFFETDWSTNSPGASDETCSTAGGCPDEWTSLTDTSTMASVSGGDLLIAVTTDNPAYLVGTDDTESDPLYGITADEWWVEWGMKFSAVTDWQHETNMHVGQYYMDAANSRMVKFNTDASGDVVSLQAMAISDAGNNQNVCTAQAWSPSVDTEYIMRYHWKKDEDGGSETDDGEVEFSVVGGPSCNDTDWDSDTAAVIISYRMGIALGAWVTPDDYNVTFTYQKFYITDPGW